ncbi:MAG TPA: alanine racemase [Verrucomicrobiae bacterium]|nr:alanine racemase [Verrucomicrobiae bacterium]
MVPQSYYRCWVEIDLDALRHNVAAIQRRVGTGVKLMAVVKADAYGHGLAQVGGVLMQAGVNAFAVATLSEALVLRQIGGSGWPILLFGSALPFEVSKMIEQNITPTLSTVEEARLFEEEAARCRKTVDVQVEVDTGMGRVGFWHEEAPKQIAKLATFRHVRVTAFYTHFPSADENLDETRRELKLFLEVVHQIRESAGGMISVPSLLHAANSAAVLNLPEAALDMVRPGLLLYGIAPGTPQVGTDRRSDEFRPALSFKARVAYVKRAAAGRTISYGQTFTAQKPMKIATVTAGYADGFSRHLSNKAQVLIGGTRCPVVGRVTMDQIMVDVTALGKVECGDEVVFIGRQMDEQITASEVAGWEETIAWEVLCGITKTARVPRVYRGIEAA